MNNRFLFIVLALGLIFSCSTETPPNDSPPPVVKNLLSVQICDKETNDVLTDVTMDIIELKKSLLINNGIYSEKLIQRNYTIFFYKHGYITRGYQISLNKKQSITVRLEQLSDAITYDYESLSGSFKVDGTNYTGEYQLATATKDQSEMHQIPADVNGSFAVNSVCGDLTVSAWSMNDGKIHRIIYQKNINLIDGDIPPVGPVELNFISADALFYKGSKPLGSDLEVFVNGKFLVAKQSAGSDFNFNLDGYPADPVILEAVDYSGNQLLFTKKSAVSDQSTDLTFVFSSYPQLGAVRKNGEYQISFNKNSQASYYEAVVVNSDYQPVIELINLTGTVICIPEIFLNTVSGPVLHFSWISIAGFNQEQLLLDSQNMDSYSYSGNSIELGSVVSANRIQADQSSFRKIGNRHSIMDR